MILTCPECATSYAAPDGVISTEGRKVKCRKCAHVWLAKDTDTDETDLDFEVAADSETANEAENQDDDTDDGLDWGVSGISYFDGDGDDDDLNSAIKAEIDFNSDNDVECYESITQDDQPSSLAGTGIGRLAPMLARAAAIAAILMIVAGSAFAARTQVVRMMPGTAKLFAAIGYPVNLRGLEFQNITFNRGFEDGLPVLAIQGEVVNITSEPQFLPTLRFALRDELTREVYYWTGTVGQDFLAPGQTIPFTTRLASPPVTARNVMVRFTGHAPG